LPAEKADNKERLMNTTQLARALLTSSLLLASLLQPLPVAAAPNSPDDPIPSSLLDPNSVAWLSVRNMTSDQYAAYFDERSRQGYMVIDIEVDEIDDKQRVGAVWQENLDNRGWYQYRNMSQSEFETTQSQLRAQGFRVLDQEAYELDGNRYFAGVWYFNTEELEWISYYDKTDAEFATLFDRYSGAGYMMIDVDAYPVDGQIRFASVWVDNSEDLDWQEWRDMTSDEFSDKFDELQGQFRMIDVESYRIGSSQYYAGIWVENANGRGWAEWRNMTSKGFGDKWLELRDAGYRLIDYEAYPTDDGWRYAGIWRQNSRRPDWSLKDEVDSLLEEHADDFDIPGMSVAVAQNGTFLYLRGFGYADIDDEVIAHSRTIYRLASVSKAVAGVLGLRLEDLGLVDLDDATRDLIPAMPDHHTHTLIQTLSNRSGIGHYEDYPGISGDYTTALAPAMELWDKPLVYVPGDGYKYSTHAYTFFGASLEAALGDPIGDILEERLRVPYDLNTLRVEDLDISPKFRATLYNTSNDEVSQDNLTWKVLGGGLESSAYDLARFGIKLLNESILPQTTLDRMWTPPDGESNYALGWNTGTHMDTFVVAKDGAQNGSRSYIRMYPDEGIVITVLTNRKNGGHDPASLAKEIGRLMLEAAAQSAALADPLDLAQEPIEEPLEPEDEATDPALEVVPIVQPVADPSPEDLQEQTVDALIAEGVYLPMVIAP